MAKPSAKPSEKLARSLEILQRLQEQGRVAIRTAELSRTHRERLVANGFLREVIKRWYIPTRPDGAPGESTAWYASFWDFCAEYLGYRFGRDWCVSPEQSLSLHVGNRTVPSQLVVRARKATNNVVKLPHNTSLLDITAKLPPASDIEKKEGMRVYSLPAALVACTPNFFTQNPTDTRAALSAIRDASDLLDRLLESGLGAAAGRLAGAFRNIGRDRIADDILKAMKAASYDAREKNPFDGVPPVILGKREPSPYVIRIRLMWQQMREPTLKAFPKPPGMPNDADAYLDHVNEIYVTDAYHSLSIEGYRVSRYLIERVRSGAWNPELNDHDKQQRDAIAARGYFQAYRVVQKSIRAILRNANPGDVLDDDHGTWYRELFAPSIAAGLLKPSDLAGYRNDQVYIRRSIHVPPSRDAVRDLMPAFFDLLREENEAAVRVVLGHFMFVYIHPYMDGNGRIARFLMNSMLASGGYPWTVIPVETRTAYLAALEDASVRQNITPFAEYLAGLVTATMKGKPKAQPPKE